MGICLGLGVKIALWVAEWREKGKTTVILGYLP